MDKVKGGGGLNVEMNIDSVYVIQFLRLCVRTMFLCLVMSHDPEFWNSCFQLMVSYCIAFG